VCQLGADWFADGRSLKAALRGTIDQDRSRQAPVQEGLGIELTERREEELLRPETF
jgi:hypothetical protein